MTPSTMPTKPTNPIPPLTPLSPGGLPALHTFSIKNLSIGKHAGWKWSTPFSINTFLRSSRPPRYTARHLPDVPLVRF